VTRMFIDSVPELGRFSQGSDTSSFVQVPDDWSIGISDVVNSSGEISAGRYKAVNLAGASTIRAVANALGGHLPLFVFGGDGAHFAVPPRDVPLARDALARVAMWAERDLGLVLRVGMVKVSDVRAAGHDVLVAFWRASNDLRYAMFAGGGLEWVDTQLKNGSIALSHEEAEEEPDLSGLSCQWGPILPHNGKIVSLIVKPALNVDGPQFADRVSRVLTLLEETGCLNPVPGEGPQVRWPDESMMLQSSIAHNRYPLWLRRLRVQLIASIMWLIFKYNIRIGQFNPRSYRYQIGANTDYQKYNDGLIMTADCSSEVLQRLRDLLHEGAVAGVIRYGIHVQDEALMTCIVPSVFGSDHMHFVDGAGGGYAAAARMLKMNDIALKTRDRSLFKSVDWLEESKADPSRNQELVCELRPN
jgi:hypothetical protein